MLLHSHMDVLLNATLKQTLNTMQPLAKCYGYKSVDSDLQLWLEDDTSSYLA